MVYLIGFNKSEIKEINEIIIAHSEQFKKIGMNTLINNFDAIEKLIHEENLRIIAVDFHPDLDVMLIILNTKAVLHQRLSSYAALLKSDKNALTQYELIANGTGVSWPLLNEDLSLKGFLQDELRDVVSLKDSVIV